MPRLLKVPLAVGHHLREDTVKQSGSSSTEESISSKGDEIKSDISPHPIDETVNGKAKEDKKSTGLNEPPTTLSFMQLLHSYTKPLLIFSNGSGQLQSTDLVASGTNPDRPEASRTSKEGSDFFSKDGNSTTGPGSTLAGFRRRQPNQQTDSNRAGGRARSQTERLYPMPTVIIVALISFLVGSLLRSLLSPAEFVAEMPLTSGDEGTAKGGYEWREIKRLVEIKYLIGGWDFVVAVVRRP